MLESELLNLPKYNSQVLDIQMKLSILRMAFLSVEYFCTNAKLTRKQTKFYLKPWLTSDIQKHTTIRNNILILRIIVTNVKITTNF